jgi:phage terminase small subunit
MKLSKKDIEIKVEEYITAVKNSIEKEYTFIPPEWSAHLQQLEDYYWMYLNASKSLRETSLLNIGSSTTHDMKSVYISIMNDSLDRMKKITDIFGLSPLSKKRLKSNDKVDAFKAVSTPEEDYLSSM